MTTTAKPATSKTKPKPKPPTTTGPAAKPKPARSRPVTATVPTVPFPPADAAGISTAVDVIAAAPTGLLHLPLDVLLPHPRNVRRDTTPDDGFVTSIREHGVLQPIVVVPAVAFTARNPALAPLLDTTGRDLADCYVVEMGNRRLAGARSAGLPTIPAVIDQVDRVAGARVAMLVENLQRQDLDEIEEAEAFSELLTELACSQHDLADRLGYSQSHISKRISLLKLPDAARTALQDKAITVGQATAITRLRDDLAAEVVERIANPALAAEDREEVIELALDRQDRDEKRAQALDDLEHRGIKVMTDQPHERWPLDSWEHRVPGYDWTCTAAEHADQDCHVAHVSAHGGVTYYCTTPQRHRRKTSPATGRPRSGPSRKRRELIAANRLAKESDATRAAWLDDHAARIFNPGYPEAAALLADALLNRFGPLGDHDHALAATWLHLDVPKPAYGQVGAWAVRNHLHETAAGADVALRVATLVVKAAQALSLARTGRGTSTWTGRDLAFLSELIAAGYPASEYEHDLRYRSTIDVERQETDARRRADVEARRRALAEQTFTVGQTVYVESASSNAEVTEVYSLGDGPRYSVRLTDGTVVASLVAADLLPAPTLDSLTTAEPPAEPDADAKVDVDPEPAAVEFAEHIEAALVLAIGATVIDPFGDVGTVIEVLDGQGAETDGTPCDLWLVRYRESDDADWRGRELTVLPETATAAAEPFVEAP